MNVWSPLFTLEGNNIYSIVGVCVEFFWILIYSLANLFTLASDFHEKVDNISC